MDFAQILEEQVLYIRRFFSLYILNLGNLTNFQMKNHYWQQLAFLVFFLTIFVVADGFGQRKPTGMVKIKGSPPEEFPVFYDRFHADSTFQMSRIFFPIKGLRVEGTVKSPWTTDNWELMQTRIYEVDSTRCKTKVKLKKKNFEQTMWIEDTNFSSKRRFELLGNRWFLVYAYEGSL